MFDVVWISVAFVFGFAGQRVGLPPLAGYLVAGFVLGEAGANTGETLAELSELGITLLLFTIGLKLRVRTLARPQIWATACIHMALYTALGTAALIGLAALGIGALAGLDGESGLLIGFALSYSSTVFAVKFLESRGEMATYYGRITVGILLVQDVAAVVFMAISVGKLPSPWALLLIPGLIPLKWLLALVLRSVGHGELLILFGLAASVGGVELFELLQLKGDLGALMIGVLLANHPDAEELAKTMLGYKDLFLVGFFLSVGLGGAPQLADLLVAGALVALLPLKSFLYFWLLTRFRMRARSGFLAAVGLCNYSEFGLIVAAVGAENGWLSSGALGLLATTLALSLVAASPLNERSLPVYRRLSDVLRGFQSAQRVAEEAQIRPGPAAALVFGMGRVGTGAYDRLHEESLGRIVGIDSGPDVVAEHRRHDREVALGSGTDLEFWSRLDLDVAILRLVVLTMPTVEENSFAAAELRRRGYTGRVSAIVKYDDHEKILANAGADHVFNFYGGAGIGIAEEAIRDLAAEGKH